MAGNIGGYVQVGGTGGGGGGGASLTSGAVTSGYIGDNAVVSGSIASGAVSQNKLASGAVNTNQIASGSINWFNIGSGAVHSGHLASGLLANISAVTVTDSMFVTTELISGGRAVAFSQSGTIRIAMAGVSGRMPAVGVVKDNIGSGGFVTLYRGGRLFNNSSGTPFDFSGYPDVPVYVGLSGDVVASGAPVASGNIQQIMGVTISQSGLMVQIGDPFERGFIGSGDIASGTLFPYDASSGFIARAAQFGTTLQSGTAWSLITGEIISGVKAVQISQSGFLRVAMASVSGKMPAIGIVVDNVLSGIPANVYHFGSFQFSSGMADYSGQLGKRVFVGRSGQLVSWSGSFNSGGFNVASGADFFQPMGWIINSGAAVLNVGTSFFQTQLIGVNNMIEVADRQFGV